MPEEIDGRKIFSLFEVTTSIQKTIAERYKTSYWIKAEMNKLNYYRQSGHCYPDLVEKKEGKVIAQIKCNLWKEDYIRINLKFKHILNEPLKDGIKVLLLATVSFHPEFGLALRIIDIDPAYTLGDLEKEKQETIKRLQSEGIFRKNKSLKIALLPQRIAIISVQTSNGYADFLRVFEEANNAWGYRFFHLLFPSLLQSDKAVPAIIRQLNRIRKVISHFDIVAIVRGGGGDVGLSCYNNYELAKEIAMFPIPVLTGIGHSTNETVVEMIAFEYAITPTKLAEYLIQKFHDFSVPVQKANEKIIDKSKRLILEEKSRFQSEVKLFRSVTNVIILRNKNTLRENITSLLQHSRFRFKHEQAILISLKDETVRNSRLFCESSGLKLNRTGLEIKKDVAGKLKLFALQISQNSLQLLNASSVLIRKRNEELLNVDKNISNMDPANVLKRGYSLTLFNGQAIKSNKGVSKGDIIDTILFEGNISSTVNSKSKLPDHE